ncbi:MAG: hypothetical protein JWQ20_3165 [Conexibacter sp.]|jgi:hypothetical protein|nr:hypothetical protein [Conexibacter sp.]
MSDPNWIASSLAADLEAVIATEREAGRIGGHVTLVGLLDSWRGLVEHVERGYDESVYEYANDVDSRTILERVAQAAPQAARDALLSWLGPWDERYARATVRASTPFHGHADPASPYAASPWHWRIPRLLVDELKSDLRDMGLA